MIDPIPGFIFVLRFILRSCSVSGFPSRIPFQDSFPGSENNPFMPFYALVVARAAASLSAFA